MGSPEDVSSAAVDDLDGEVVPVSVVARILVELEDGWEVARLVKVAERLAPAIAWADAVAAVDPAQTKEATREEIAAHREELLALAKQRGVRGLAFLRLGDECELDGEVDDLGGWSVGAAMDFGREASKIVGRQVRASFRPPGWLPNSARDAPPRTIPL